MGKDADIERLAFEVAFSQLNGQKEDLRNLRNQASFGAAITGLIATVFATLLSAVADDNPITRFTSGVTMIGLSIEAWFVVLSLTASLSFAILVMVSWRKCVFELSPKHILNQSSIHGVLRELATDADGFFDQNENVIQEAKSYLWWCLVLGWLQIPSWLVLLF